MSLGKSMQVAALAVLAAGLQAALVFTMAAQPKCYGRVGMEDMYDDVHIYHNYARQTFDGLVPYRDFRVEYPPLALPLFVLPEVFAHGFGDYKLHFAAEMLLFNALAVLMLAFATAQREGVGQVPGRLAWHTAFLVCLSPLVLTRFDLAPMCLAFAAALAWSRGKPGWGGTLAGAGVLVKVFPGALVLPALGHDWAQEGSILRRLKGAGAAGLVVGLGVAGWLLLGTRALADSLHYHTERGIEIGSLYGGIAFLGGKLAGLHVSLDQNHSSTEVIAAWTPLFNRLAFPLQASALLAIGLRARFRPGTDLLPLAAASLCAFIALGKVLSPQYLVWLLPFVCVMRGVAGTRARWLFLAACLLTTAIYPWGFAALQRQHVLAVLVLNARNALLLALGVVLAWPERSLVGASCDEPADRPEAKPERTWHQPAPNGPALALPTRVSMTAPE